MALDRTHRRYQALTSNRSYPRAHRLRDLRDGPPSASDWLRSVVLTRQAEAVFRGEAAMEHPLALAKSYDAIVFIDRTTRAVPTPDAKERYGPKRDR